MSEINKRLAFIIKSLMPRQGSVTRYYGVQWKKSSHQDVKVNILKSQMFILICSKLACIKQTHASKGHFLYPLTSCLSKIWQYIYYWPNRNVSSAQDNDISFRD